MGTSILNKKILRGIKKIASCKLVKRTMENELAIKQVAKICLNVKRSCNYSFLIILIYVHLSFFVCPNMAASFIP